MIHRLALSFAALRDLSVNMRVLSRLVDPYLYFDLDQLVLLASWTRVLLRSQRELHRGRLQFDWAEQHGPFLEGGYGDGSRC